MVSQARKEVSVFSGFKVEMGSPGMGICGGSPPFWVGGWGKVVIWSQGCPGRKVWGRLLLRGCGMRSQGWGSSNVPFAPHQAPRRARKRTEGGASSNVFSMFDQNQIQEFKEVSGPRVFLGPFSPEASVSLSIKWAC